MLSREEILVNKHLFAGTDPGEELWQTLQARRRRLRIMDQFCKGCGQCLPACTNHALALVDGRASVAEKDCILCGYCAAACPEFLIRVV
jgi:ferredoxin